MLRCGLRKERANSDVEVANCLTQQCSGRHIFFAEYMTYHTQLQSLLLCNTTQSARYALLLQTVRYRTEASSGSISLATSVIPSRKCGCPTLGPWPHTIWRATKMPALKVEILSGVVMRVTNDAAYENFGVTSTTQSQHS